ncbi:MAG: hypothetical protein KG003_14250, partial [Bacteroidetes bacterium]|nr:hypothetical protein [Bacteroidota bacterium]
GFFYWRQPRVCAAKGGASERKPPIKLPFAKKAIHWISASPSGIIERSEIIPERLRVTRDGVTK